MKKTATIAAAATLLALSLSACGDRDDNNDEGSDDPSTSSAASESATPSEAAEQFPDFKACMVSDSGGFDDKSFNQTSLKGQEDAAAQFGVQTAKVQSDSDTEYADNIDQLIADGCNEITTVGFLLGDATEAAAKKNPKVDFAIVDFGYEKPAANLKGLNYATDQPSFLAGYLAASQSESGFVGTFGGLNIPTVTIFMEGFRLGVEQYNKDNDGDDVTLLGWDGKKGSFTEDFNDKGKGQSVGADLIQQGADILFPVAGPAGLGGLQAAKDAGAKGIWVDTDGYESTEYGDILLTSVVKGLDVSVTEAIKESAEGTFTNEPFSGTLENDGVGLAPFHDFDGSIDQEVKDKLEELKAGIISGDITTS
ncbi:BMP family lipoprotein [Nocardioides plantarum]|uniref:BMP family protein n=1 Tax=Nocardioides plantarum TaxID=29299 RepID=A0ABV5K7D6_9ACTN|nr:BMP family ABC transporter substrate-binding protein [Nocardioides plantarum]